MPRKQKSALKAHNISPWTMLRILYKISQTRQLRGIADLYGMAPSTLFRWYKRWGHEAPYGRHDIDVPHIGQARLELDDIRKSLDAVTLLVARLQARLNPQADHDRAPQLAAPPGLGSSGSAIPPTAWDGCYPQSGQHIPRRP